MTLSEKYPGLMLPVQVIRLGGKRGGHAVIDPEDYEQARRISWLVRTANNTSSRKLYVYGRLPGGRQMSLQRFLTGHRTGHISGDTFDNRRVNLQRVDHTMHSASRRPRPGKASRFKGVYPASRGIKWTVRIMIKGQRYSLGTFNAEEDAARAYDTKLAEVAEVAGPYAMTNARLGLLGDEHGQGPSGRPSAAATGAGIVTAADDASPPAAAASSEPRLTCPLCAGIIGSCGCHWVREGPARWTLHDPGRRIVNRLTRTTDTGSPRNRRARPSRAAAVVPASHRA